MDRKLLVAVVAGALAVPMAAQAVDFSVSGHVGRAIVITDNDGDTDVDNSDTSASPSRFRFTGSNDLDAGITASVNLEYAAGKDGIADDRLRQYPFAKLRHANVSLSGDFGALIIGQQSEATDGIAYSNFDNHAWLGGVEIACDYCAVDFGGSHGGNRNEGVRYNTPSIGPATVGVFTTGNDDWDVALRMAGSAGVGGYQFKAGYADDATAGAERIVLSGAVNLPVGVHFNLAWGETDADNTGYVNVGVGYNVGESSVAANLYSSDMGGGGTAVAVGYGQSLGAGVQIFASYTYATFDDDLNGEEEMENSGTFVIGSRVAFN